MEPRTHQGGSGDRYVLGLDLGQAADFTALGIVKIVPDTPYRLILGHLRRFPLNTPYPDQVSGVAREVERTMERGAAVMAIDHTGVGRPVVDMFRAAKLGINIWPVSIATSAMGAAKRNPETNNWVVPKKDLIGSLITMAHSGRLEISDRLPDAKILKKELQNFRMKINTNANLEFEAWRESDHDDLVLAVALACWAAQRWASPGGLS